MLVVEDESTKRDRVARVLSGVDGLSEDSICYAPDLNAARSYLRERSFDLLVLDVALPARVGQDALRDGGAVLLREIVTGQLRRPDHIVGLTAYEDVHERMRGRFENESFVLLRYEASSEDWRQYLQARARHVVARRRARVETPGGYASFLFVLCALQSELDAVLSLPWTWETPPLAGDATSYHHGTVRSRSGAALDVYAAAAPRMGMVHSAVLASKAIEAFRPQYLAMTGIAAGVRGEVELGTVLTPDPAYDYDAGKWAASESGAVFAPAPYQIALDATVRDRLRRLAQRDDALAQVRSSWPAAKPTGELAVRLGPVGSGAAVVADDGTVRRAIQSQRKLVGVEMEAYGLYAAAAEAREPRPKAFALKTVVDFADSEKGDSHQAYGSYVSARVLQTFVEDHLTE